MGGASCLYGGHIYFEQKYGRELKIYFGRHFAWLKYFTTLYRYWLRTVSNKFCRRLKLEKLFISWTSSHICLFEFIRVERGHDVHEKKIRGVSYKNLGTSDLVCTFLVVLDISYFPSSHRTPGFITVFTTCHHRRWNKSTMTHLHSLTVILLFVLFMSMGWDYISKQRPSEPIVHPQITCEYGEPRWNDTDRGTDELCGKPVPVPQCPPQIPHGLTRARTLTSAVRGPVTNRLSHGTANTHFNIILQSTPRSPNHVMWTAHLILSRYYHCYYFLIGLLYRLCEKCRCYIWANNVININNYLIYCSLCVSYIITIQTYLLYTVNPVSCNHDMAWKTRSPDMEARN
jgi:hypothetical protein